MEFEGAINLKQVGEKPRKSDVRANGALPKTN